MIFGTFIAGEAKAYAASGDTTVYITKSGKKYHADGCQHLNKSKIAKFGVEQHLRNTGRFSAVNFKEYMYGKAYFIKMVEKDIGEEYLKQLDEIFSIEY